MSWLTYFVFPFVLKIYIHIYLTKENTWPCVPSLIRARGAVSQWEVWVTVKRVFFSFDCIEINLVPHVIWAWAVGSRKGSRSPAACSVDVIRATFSFYRFSAKHLLPSYVPAWVLTDVCCLLFRLVLFLEVAKLTFYICFRGM